MTMNIPADIAYRLNYVDGMFLTAGLETQEQAYFVRTTALLNAMLYTPGVLSGLAVSQASGNALSIEPGGGIDASGNFLILPGSSGNPLMVPTTAANPSVVYLVQPAPAQQVAGMQPNIANMAGVPVLAPGGAAAPPNSILLAQVLLNSQGQVTGVTDSRVPVTSRLGMPLTTNTLAVASPIPGGTPVQGTLTVPVDHLPAVGRPYSTIVRFNDQGAPSFAVQPQVLCQVQGAIPYSTAVSDITTTGFTLTLGAALVTPSSDVRVVPASVNWWAFT